MIVEDVELDADYEPYRQIAAHHCSPFRLSEADLLKLDLYTRQAIDFIERARTEEEWLDLFFRTFSVTVVVCWNY